MILQLTHVVALVKGNVNEAANFWNNAFGLVRSMPPGQGVWMYSEVKTWSVVLPFGDGTFIELAHPSEPGTPWWDFMQEGHSLYEFGFGVTEIETHMKKIRDQGLCAAMYPPNALTPQRLGFIDPSSACGGFIQLVDVEDWKLWKGPNISSGPKGIFTRLSHVAHVVDDLSEAVCLYGDVLGLTLADEHPTPWPEEGVETLTFTLGAGPAVKVMRITNPSSLLGRFHQRHGQGFAYLAFEVENLDRQIEALAGRGAWIQVARSGKVLPKRVWVHPRNTGGIYVQLLPVG